MIQKNIAPERILYGLWSHCKLTILQLKTKQNKKKRSHSLKIKSSKISFNYITFKNKNAWPLSFTIIISAFLVCVYVF